MPDNSVKVEMGDQMTVTAPYHPAFPSAAKRLGGQWASGSRSWTFDPREEVKVRELLTRIYGTDGTPVSTVDVQIHLDHVPETDSDSLFLLGRQIARRGGRDSEVRLGDGVILLQGGFAASAGSRAYPEIGPKPGTILLVHDVPDAIATEAAAKRPNAFVVADADPSAARIAILSEQAQSLREMLARIEAEIEELQKTAGQKADETLHV